MVYLLIEIETKRHCNCSAMTSKRVIIMDKDAIKQALHAKGFSFTMIAEALGVGPNAVSAIASRRGQSKRVADAIAKALEMPVEEIFPDIDSYKRDRLPCGKEKDAKRAELAKLLAS